MTLNTQQEAKTPLRRRASTPLPLSARGHQPGLLCTAPSTKSQHPRLGQSASLNPPPRQPSPAPNGWSSESSDSEGSWEALYRVVLLGDPGVGKTSLASLFAGKQERDLHEQLGEDVYERTLTVDGEDTTLVVMDTWEAEKRIIHAHCRTLKKYNQREGCKHHREPISDESWSQDSCLQVGSAYVIVYSIADRGSFESASELRIQLRRTHQADHVPIILVGNKADLARCREVSVEEGRACAVVFDCKFIETSATLQHNVAELFEGVVRQLRLRRRDSSAPVPPAPRRRASLGQRARRFLARLTARSARRALKARSKSCHNLAVL
ncbi:GTP-binding protein REM 1 isoform X1 [Neofelis nebulosa]|uniref:GTP-binding protein REM 1 isoform X1 n=1 Tax=Neofelis nebulosa TaxID=61452 RepID=UPI00272CCA6D|nr:GTP-binding protein REM 1 isoform X1 [Neofelis nebulosa]